MNPFVINMNQMKKYYKRSKMFKIINKIEKNLNNNQYKLHFKKTRLTLHNKSNNKNIIMNLSVIFLKLKNIIIIIATIIPGNFNNNRKIMKNNNQTTGIQIKLLYSNEDKVFINFKCQNLLKY